MTPEEIRNERNRRRNLARFRFRSLCRKVIVNAYWLSELDDQKIGENARRNIAIIVRRKSKKGILTLFEKSILNTPINQRSEEQMRRIANTFTTLDCLKRFPPYARVLLASVAFFHYFAVGRVLVRETHTASAVYFILTGEVKLTQRKLNTLDNTVDNEVVAVLGAGDMFGEDAVLLNIPRTATAETATDCEVLCIYKVDFDRILKDILQKQWDQVQLAMQRFDYFHEWTDSQIREACILSRIKEYSPQQNVYCEDTGLTTSVHFVLSGKCMILQCLRVQVQHIANTKKYTLHELEEKPGMHQQDAGTGVLARQNTIGGVDLHTSSTKAKLAVIIEDELSQTSPAKIGQHNISARIENVFIDVGLHSAGSVFGLGEQMQNRAVVAKTVVQCLLIPRYFLLQKKQNIGNVWQRTKIYLDTAIPSRLALFDDFKRTQRWKRFKRKLVNEFVRQHPSSINMTRPQDIPIICRFDGS